MDSLNKRYCVSSFFVSILIFFVILLSFTKFHTEASFASENSSLVKTEISVVKIAKTVRTTKISQTPVKEKKLETLKNEERQKSETKTTVQEAEDLDKEAEINENIAEAEKSKIPAETSSFPSAELKETEKSYKAYVLNRIASKKTYPLSARKKGNEGKVKVHLVIDKDGKILALEICDPCGFEALNNAALKSVEKAAPFKKMADIMTSLDFVFVLDFKLSAVESCQ